jgi:hypothetical protein
VSRAARLWLVVLAAGALVVFLLGIALIALRAWCPGSAEFGIAWITGFTAPDSWWGVTIVAAAASIFWIVQLRLRPMRRRRSSLVPLLGLGATTIVLGLAAYLPCPGGQSPFWAPIGWTIALFVGNAEDPFGAVDGCAPGMPLALQIARLTALLTLSLGIADIVGVLFRDRLDRLRTRRSNSVAFVSGVDESSLSILRRVRSELPRRTLVAVLVDEDTPPSVHASARAAGCAVFEVGTIDERTLRPLVSSGRSKKSSVVAIYCIRPEAATNLRVLRQFQAVERTLRRSTATPRAVIRIDDPWQAEYWRRVAIGSPDGWILDTTSVFENSARVVVQNLLDRGIDRVALVGDTPLALAVLAELAQRRRELDASRSVSATTIPALWVIGEDATELVDHHQLRQRRFGNRRTAFTPSVVQAAPQWQALQTVLQDAVAPAVVIADPVFAERFSSSLAARNQHWSIYAYDPGAKGLAVEAVMERLYYFGPILDPPSWAAIDAWERVARIVHANYLHDLRQQDVVAETASAREWDELSPFYRASNVRLITTTLTSAGTIGRSWADEPPQSTGATPAAFSPDDIRTMAELEHQSWLAHLLEDGWALSEFRDDAAKRHNWMLPWNQLPSDAVARSEGTVRDALELLGALGYHSIPSTPPVPQLLVETDEWRRAQRTGTVAAVRLVEPFRWLSQNGDEMTAIPGDWRLTDSDGESWSVADPEFQSSHAQLEGDTWMRTGEVAVRPGVAGEIVHTIEGSQTVAEGNWVVRGTRGELWSVPAERFAAGYRLLE